MFLRIRFKEITADASLQFQNLGRQLEETSNRSLQTTLGAISSTQDSIQALQVSVDVTSTHLTNRLAAMHVSAVSGHRRVQNALNHGAGTLTSINDRVSQIHDLQTTFGSHLSQLSQMAEAIRDRVPPETPIYPELQQLVDIEGVDPEIELVVPLRSMKDLLIDQFWNPLRPPEADFAIEQSALEVMTKEVHRLLVMSYALSQAAVSG
jgi:hypothetical protein